MGPNYNVPDFLTYYYGHAYGVRQWLLGCHCVYTIYMSGTLIHHAQRREGERNTLNEEENENQMCYKCAWLILTENIHW